MASQEQFIRSLVEILVENKALTHERAVEIEQAFHESPSDNFDAFLLEEGIVERDDLLRALSQHYNVPSFDVVGNFFDEQLLRNFPKDFLLRNNVIPLQTDANMLIVVAAEPERSGLESALREYENYDVDFFVGLRRDIEDAVKEYYDKAPTEVDEDQDLREEHNREEELRREIEGEDEED